MCFKARFEELANAGKGCIGDRFAKPRHAPLVLMSIGFGTRGDDNLMLRDAVPLGEVMEQDGRWLTFAALCLAFRMRALRM